MKPIRIQLSRRKGWRMPENTVRVSRPSQYSNPFNATQKYVAYIIDTKEPGVPLMELRTPASLDRCLDMYQGWLTAKVQADPGFLIPLRGKNLGCWCALDAPCHADILLRLANE